MAHVHPFPDAGAGRHCGGPFEAMCDDALDWLERAPAQVATLAALADAAIEPILAGGRLWAAGSPGLVAELHRRAGGFPFTRRQPLAGTAGPGDVVLAGLLRAAEPACPLLRFLAEAARPDAPAQTVLLSAHRDPLAARVLPGLDADDRLHLVDTGAPPGRSLRALALAQLGATALAWTWSAELLAAATRRGVALATHVSDFHPGAAAWDAEVASLVVHPRHRAAPIAPGQLGRAYLAACRRQLDRFASTQAAAVRRAARRIADGLERGGVVWIVVSGHLHAEGALLLPGLDRLVLAGREKHLAGFEARMAPGDVLVWFGYLRYPATTLERVLARGADAVVVTCDDGPDDDRRTHVLGCWDDWDAVVEVPGYPVRAIPSSAVVQTPEWYGLLAELADLLGIPADA